LFVYYTTAGYGGGADFLRGYNDDVDGWVQHSDTIFPGAFIPQTSVFEGAQHEIKIMAQLVDGNWWVYVNGEPIGYYPGELFDTTGLREKADSIAWYGEVTDFNDGITTPTDMGSGAFAHEGWGRAAYMRNLQFRDLATVLAAGYNPAGGAYASGEEGWWNTFRQPYNPNTRHDITDADCYSIGTHFLSGSLMGELLLFRWSGAEPQLSVTSSRYWQFTHRSAMTS
jgi:Neprosin